MTIDSDCNKLVSLFYHYIHIQNQRSIHTAKSYCLDVEQYLFYLNEPVTIVETNHVKQYLAHLHDRELSHSSIHRKISSLNQFWQFLIQQHIVETNPWAAIKRPRIKQTIPSYIPTETVLELLDNYPVDSNEHIRNKCLLELFFATGMRVSECCSLNIDDVLFSNFECRVIGKGSKERLVLFGERCYQWLHEYINHVRVQWAPQNETALFLTKRGSRITQRTIQRILNDANKYHSSPIQITPHTCRHSCASMLIINGAGIRDVQELLGHSSINTTQRYAHIPSKKLTQRFLNVMDDDTT